MGPGLSVLGPMVQTIFVMDGSSSLNFQMSVAAFANDLEDSPVAVDNGRRRDDALAVVRRIIVRTRGLL